MRDRVRTVLELPDWFKIENYAKTKIFTPEDWYQELSFRDNTNLPRNLIEEKLSAIAEYSLCVSMPSDSPWGDPLSEFDPTTIEKVANKYDTRNIDPNTILLSKLHQSLIQPATFFDALHTFIDFDQHQADFEKTVEKAHKAGRNNYFRNYKLIDNGMGIQVSEDDIITEENMVFEEKSYYLNPIPDSCSFIDQDIDAYHKNQDIDAFQRLTFTSKTAVLKVNFEASNQELINSFKKVIDVYRDFLNVKEPAKIVTPNTLKTLHQYQILPYLDLTLWAVLNHKNIPNKVYAAALYPLGQYGEKTIRSTLKPLSTKVFEPQFLNTLKEMSAKN